MPNVSVNYCGCELNKMTSFTFPPLRNRITERTDSSPVAYIYSEHLHFPYFSSFKSMLKHKHFSALFCYFVGGPLQAFSIGNNWNTPNNTGRDCVFWLALLLLTSFQFLLSYGIPNRFKPVSFNSVGTLQTHFSVSLYCSPYFVFCI